MTSLCSFINVLVVRCAFDPTGQFLASGSSSNKAFVWKISDAVPVSAPVASSKPAAELSGACQDVTAVAWSNVDPFHLVACAEDSTVRMWKPKGDLLLENNLDPETDTSCTGMLEDSNEMLDIKTSSSPEYGVDFSFKLERVERPSESKRMQPAAAVSCACLLLCHTCCACCRTSMLSDWLRVNGRNHLL